MNCCFRPASSRADAVDKEEIGSRYSIKWMNVASFERYRAGTGFPFGEVILNCHPCYAYDAPHRVIQT